MAYKESPHKTKKSRVCGLYEGRELLSIPQILHGDSA